MSTAATVALGEIMPSRDGPVDPANHPEEVFDLYSIPAFDNGLPEVVAGRQIGSAKQIVRPGDVLLSRIVPHIRRTWIVSKNSNRRTIASGEWIVFRSARADPSYLRHVLVGDPFHSEFMRTVSGVGGSLLRARPAYVAQIRIPLPSLQEQRRIAEILDRAEALRAKRRAALAQLDTLTQSIFLDMFGDPSRNPKGWSRVEVGDVVFGASDGPHVSPEYSEDGIPFLSTRNVRAGEIIWKDLKFISREDAEIHWRKCRPVRGDVLYTKGGTTGLAAAVRTTEPFALWVHVALLKPNPSKVDPIWLESMLNTEFCYRQSQELTHGIANRDLGLTRMVKIRMFLPPLHLQRDFVRCVAALEELRARQQSAVSQVNALFESLQHRAFRGEL